ncbi:MAG TPA: FAD synthetase family protein [Candidatus Saccharimonadales bacterium]|nr:FAD synthetase family protein [Candidatus Saccharimonadales bacterium]
MDVVAGVDGLRPEHGPSFAVVGVFDGLHRGHAYLLEHLVDEAHARGARPTVITFDHHPDEVLTGSAPPLLIHPDERLERLEGAGVEVTVVQPFDDAVRRTPYDVFVEDLRARTTLAGLLMTPDAAFGFERRGTPDALRALGRRVGFDVVVVPPYALDGRAVRSTDIRTAIGSGDLATAAALLGRPVTLRGTGDGTATIHFEWPLALPPQGAYQGLVDGEGTTIAIDGARRMELERPLRRGPVEVTLVP